MFLTEGGDRTPLRSAPPSSRNGLVGRGGGRRQDILTFPPPQKEFLSEPPSFFCLSPAPEETCIDRKGWTWRPRGSGPRGTRRPGEEGERPERLPQHFVLHAFFPLPSRRDGGSLFFAEDRYPLELFKTGNFFWFFHMRAMQFS